MAASTALLAAAAVLLSILWFTSKSTSSTSFTAQLPTTLLGIELDVSEGDVEILGGARPSVVVSRVDTSAFGHAPTEQRSIADGVLRIESSCPDLVIGACAADYRLTLPDYVPVRVVASEGDIRLNAYRGPAVLATRGGSLAIDAFCGSVLDATTSGGDIEVAATCPPDRLTLRTTSGDITARVPPSRYSVDAVGDDVNVRGVPDDPAAGPRIQAVSGSGDVTVEAG